MTRTLFLVSVALGALLLASLAQAGISLLGPTGGGQLPTAGTVGADNMSLFLGRVNEAEDFVDAEIGDVTAVRSLYGINDRIELGGGFDFQSLHLLGISAEPTEFTNWNAATVNGKVVLPAKPVGFDLAAGFVFYRFSQSEENFSQLYLVGTKQFAGGDEGKMKIFGSVGASYNDYTAESTDDTTGYSKSFVRGFANVTAAWPKFSLTAEYATKVDDEDDALTALTARYMINEQYSVEIGTTNGTAAGLMTTDDHNVFFGISSTFNTASAE